jgi:hypothetical protein
MMDRVVRTRYIVCGLTEGNVPINRYRLIAGNRLGSKDIAIRVRLPSDLVLDKYSCDSYSTTKDIRTLNELGYDVIVRINGRWVVRNDLKGIRPCDIPMKLLHEGLSISSNNGFVKRKTIKIL